MTRLSYAYGWLCLLSLCGYATAQDQTATERERELEKQVRELLIRMDQLERRLAAQEAGKPPQGSERPAGAATDGSPGPQPSHDEQGASKSGAAPLASENQPELHHNGSPTSQPGPDEVEARLSKIEERLFKYPSPLDMYWQEGIRFASPDGRFKFKLGGRVQLDGGIMDADDRLERGGFNPFERGIGDLEDAVEFRTARLYLEGEIYEDAFFKVEYDFTGGEAEFKDVYMGLKNIPWIGNLRAGHFKEPFGLEQLSADRYLTFMERPLGDEAFLPARNTGLMIHDAVLDERMTWQAGGFVRTDSFGDGEFNNGFDSTARVTGLLWYEDDGAHLMHLGTAYSHQNFEGDRDDGEHQVRYRQRPEAHLAEYFVDTGSFYAESANLLGVEAAWVYGPLRVQSEYIRNFTDGVGQVFWKTPNPQFQSFYLMTSYFLTGEQRLYNKRMGTFDQVKPKRNFREDGGWGAWEVAARYSMIDLDDDEISGGELDDLTFGLNWYLNPNMRLMFNYVYADLEDSGDANLFLVRMQVDF